MRATDAVKFSNIAATTAAFGLNGGRYAVGVIATFGGGSVKFQQVGPDGSTMIDLEAPFNNAGTEADLVISTFLANGMKVFDVPPGQYKIVITTASAVYVNIVRVPIEA